MVDLVREIARREGALTFRAPSASKTTAIFQSVAQAVKLHLLESHGELLRRSVTDLNQKALLREAIKEVLEAEQLNVPGSTQSALADALLDEIAGLSVLEPLLRDASITDIFVNGPDQVFIERNGVRERSAITFSSSQDLLHVIGRIADRIGRKVNESTPLLDARLPDGSRVNAVIPPAALTTPRLTIRKHTTRQFTPDSFLQGGFLNDEMVRFLQAAIHGKLNILIAGGTGAGKTTTLRLLASFIPPHERVVTVEDTEELRLYELLENCVASEATHTTDLYALVVNALRENPDRLIVGEVRHKEGWALIEAMSTGHDGSMTTVHASSAGGAVKRLTRILLRAGMEINAAQLEEQVCTCIDLICLIRRTPDGRRRMVSITEVESGGLRPIYAWNHLDQQFEPCSAPSAELVMKMRENGLSWSSEAAAVRRRST
jgi:pilus assembly protein CpaF